MEHFVKAMQAYISHQVVEISWHEFQSDLEKATDIEDMQRFHANYLNKCIFR